MCAHRYALSIYVIHYLLVQKLMFLIVALKGYKRSREKTQDKNEQVDGGGDGHSFRDCLEQSTNFIKTILLDLLSWQVMEPKFHDKPNKSCPVVI